MRISPIPIWKEAPFLRLLIPFAGGIFAQSHFQWSAAIACMGLGVSVTGIIFFSIKNITAQFKQYWVYGLFLNGLLFFTGTLLLFSKNGSANRNLITRLYSDNAIVAARLDEPLSAKLKSFKTIASVGVVKNNSLLNVSGKIIIYFKNDSSAHLLDYGSRIVFKKPLQPIKNTGNPGSFDYRKYCLFQQIYYQVFLKPGEYKILPAKQINYVKSFLFDTRKNIIKILRKNIVGAKESGLAEALLIGYKDDLDKSLVQSYSDTGVVHIIAISGLHVGLIYWLLTTFLNFFPQHKEINWLKPLLVIIGLWLFSLLAGGSPSVLRSALMFTFIVLGKNISGKTSVYNSLAASAFLLLCFNPYWLWDVGFQLSYAAVLSIIIFMKPIYNWWFLENKILDAVWKLNAVTLAAQVLTLPICLYYFHQFPTLFLITNLIAVPLSSIILLGELLLCLISMFPVIAKVTGLLLHWMIWLMNTFIERMGRLPYAVLGEIQISFLQLISLYIFITGISVWLLRMTKKACIGALAGLLFFGIARIHTSFLASQQQKIIVYNIPYHQAIDFIDGKNYVFRGDSVLLEENFLQNFHLRPSRTAQRIKKRDSLPSLSCNDVFFQFHTKSIVIIEGRLPKVSRRQKIQVDLIIISGNPGITMHEIDNIFACKQIIFDASNSHWKISNWITDCNTLQIPCYSVPQKGAFVMNLN